MGHKSIRVALIGYGGMAGYHANVINKLEDYELAGSFDIDPARQIAAKADGLHVYQSYQEIAADPTVDAVLIATPNDVHAFYTTYFAAHNKHIICEKPAAMSSQEFHTMSEAANVHGVILAVHQNRRQDADFLTVCRLKDKYKDIYRVESNVVGANGIPGGWRKLQRHGGGMMLDWGVHLLDQLLLLDETPVTSVDCFYSYREGYECDDGFRVELTFESGLSAAVRVDTNTFIPLPRWYVYGDSSTSIIKDWDLNGETVEAVFDDTPIEGIKAGNGFTKTMAYRPPSAQNAVPLPSVKSDWALFYQDFREACDGVKPFPILHKQVERVLKLMEVCKESADRRDVIKNIRL